MQPWTRSTASREAVERFRQNTVSGLPGSPQVRAIRDYSSPEEFVQDAPTILHPQERVEAMHRDGFTRGAQIDYESTVGPFEILVLEFDSNEAAIDYSKTHLRDACVQATSATRLSTGNGLTYHSQIDHVTFVSGNAEISMCGCFGGPGAEALLETTARNLQQQLADEPT